MKATRVYRRFVSVAKVAGKQLTVMPDVSQ